MVGPAKNPAAASALKNSRRFMVSILHANKAGLRETYLLFYAGT
jgi:hypothetical protein